MAEKVSSETKSVSRRAALVRLGLGAAAVYAAPTITRLDREAQARWSGSYCRGKHCGKKKKRKRKKKR